MTSKVSAIKLLNELPDSQHTFYFLVVRIDLYRVAYDSENYRLIAQQLMVDHERILDNNRAQLLDDAFVLASVHLLPYKSALDLSLYLKYEKEYVPWNAVLSELSYIDSMLYSQPQYSHWLVHTVKTIWDY
jgi:hypothetical protein